MLTAFYAAADDSNVAVGASLEEFAMASVGLADQDWAGASIDDRPDW